ncbi:MAG: pitrilysin family protein [Bacillota bacterium]|jgi:predicted Zn-dependent peptidase|nr:pitrilysin family protein [Bacillota bacterium]
MYQETVLKNNLTIVYERIPFVRSVSFGLWIGAGSRYETREQNGISHFIEHMLFKGTGTRTAEDIARTIDNIGGQINAFTGKECTCFYTKTLDEDLPTAIELISDMLFNSTFEPVHIETERKVIAEEISMYEDYPEEMVHDMLTEEVWSGNSLGYPILGNYYSVAGITRDDILNHMRAFYVPENSVISVAGNFNDKKLLDLVEKYFGHWQSHNYCKIHAYKPWFNRSIKVKKKETEQVHMCLGFRGVKQGEENLYSLLTLNNILGGGMSSRLFQKVREELGLAYSIYSYPTAYRDVGMFTIYAACSPQQHDEVIRNIRDEIISITREKISDSDIEKAKNQLKGSFILGLESTSSRMNSMGKSQLVLGKVRTPQEILDSIEKVSRESIYEIIRYVFRPEQMGISAIGDIDMDNRLLDKIAF